jgi:hypothetical protein
MDLTVMPHTATARPHLLPVILLNLFPLYFSSLCIPHLYISLPPQLTFRQYSAPLKCHEKYVHLFLTRRNCIECQHFIQFKEKGEAIPVAPASVV